jgi:hypothetical protein
MICQLKSGGVLACEQQTAQGLDPYALLITDIEARIAELEAELRQPDAPQPVVEPSRPFRPEGLKHRTDRGEKVRSKSEVIIANCLHGLGVGYFYERALTAKDGSTLLPDFTVFDSERQPILWEHLGMLHEEAYAQRWQEKLSCYQANGFTVGVNLFITRDEPDGSLDSMKISRVAKFIQAIAA